MPTLPFTRHCQFPDLPSRKSLLCHKHADIAEAQTAPPVVNERGIVVKSKATGYASEVVLSGLRAKVGKVASIEAGSYGSTVVVSVTTFPPRKIFAVTRSPGFRPAMVL